MYALRRENGDVLYFDAVTDIEEQYSSTVTKHPIATGSFISDHTVTDNKKFTLSAVLSDADFNLERPRLTGGIVSAGTESQIDPQYDSSGRYELANDTSFWTLRTNKQYQNNTPTNTTVKIEPNKTETWKRFLPESIGQYTKDSIPRVTVTQQTKVKTAIAVRDEMIQMWTTKERFSLLEYRDNIITRYWENIIFTNLSFAQDADSGMGLFPQMQLEQAVYKDIDKVEIKVRRIPNKGRKNGEVTKQQKKPGDDAQNEPTDNKGKSAIIRMRDTATGG